MDRRNYVFVSGFNTDYAPEIRQLLRREFSKVGAIIKLFVEESGRYAKVYYTSYQTCDQAVKEFQRNNFGFKVAHGKVRREESVGEAVAEAQSPLQPRNNFTKSNSSREEYPEEEISEMDYLEDEFTENHEYCNVHGQPLMVFQSDSGDLYVKLKDVKKAGFAIFRRDTYSSILVDKSQIRKEFELHLLSEAQSYLLTNKVNFIDTNTILETIEKCKTIILSGETSAVNDLKPTSHYQNSNKNAPSFNDKNDRAGAMGQERTNYGNFGSNVPPRIRPPKTLPNNFMPSQSYTANINQNTRRPRDSNREFDGKDKSNNRDNYKPVGRGGYRQNNRGYNNRETPKTESQDFNKGFENGINEENQNQKSTSNMNSSATNETKQNLKQLTAKVSEPPKTIPNDEVKIGNTYKVQISYCDGNQENIYWIQKEESLDLCNQLLLDISEIEGTTTIVTKPVEGQLVLAEFEGAWSRAVVLDPNTKLVRFVDYGNECQVDVVKAMPDQLSSVPAYGIRVIINRNSKQLNEGDSLTITITKRYDECTFLAEHADSSPQLDEVITPPKNQNNEVKAKKTITDEPKQHVEIEKPQEKKMSKSYLDVPKPISNLKDGDKVMFIDLIGCRLAVKTKECVDKNKELLSYIKELDKTALIINTVKEGQLVLCSKEGINGLCRAIVTEIRDSNIVTVKFVDYSGENTLTLKSLRNVDDYLSKQPAALLLSPELSYLNNHNNTATNLVNELITRKEKAVVVISGSKLDFRLASNDLLSEFISNNSSTKTNFVEQPSVSDTVKDKKEEPKLKTEESRTQEMTPGASGIIYDDMSWIELKAGENEVICFYLKDSKNITVLPTDEKYVNYLEQLLELQDPDNTPYTPEAFEMCLVFYAAPDEAEGTWYRGVVIDIMDNEYTVLMVDYGNETTTESNNLRRFPSKLKDIPILGSLCEFIDVNNTPEVTKMLKKLVETAENIKIVVKEYIPTSYKYIVDIPNVREELKSAGLC